MNQSHDTCTRFEASLTEYLQGDLSSGEMTWMAAHRDECARCMNQLQIAAETEAALAGWIVPEPPDRLRERIRRLIRNDQEPEQVHCSDLRADLDAWRAGDLDACRGESLRLHSGRCAPCAHQVRIAEGVDRLLAAWPAPEPQAGFSERVLGSLRSLESVETRERGNAPPRGRMPGPASRPQPTALRPRSRRLFGLGQAALLAAAALLLVTYLGLRHSNPGPGRRSRSPHTAAPVQEMLARYERDVRLRAVSNEQFPGGIGLFDAQPLVLDRGRRISGNAFHRSLRKTLALTALQADLDADR